MANYTRKETDEDGDTCYYNDKGQYHRLDGPAIEYADGSKMWWVNGKRHRLDGPAIEGSNGGKEWWVNGKRHRLDGPAIEYADGGKSWYVDDKNLTEEKFNRHPLVVETRMVSLISEVLEER